jgi:glycosyltransferase 2 family protein
MRVPRSLAVLAGVVVVLAFVFALAAQAGEIARYDWQVAPEYLIVALAVALLRGPLIVYPWWRIVRSWGYDFRWWWAVRHYFHSGLARYIPGQFWFVPARALLAEREGVPKTVTTASTLVETVIVTGSAGGVALLGLATVPGWNLPVRALLLIGGVLVPVALVAATGSPLSARFWNWLLGLIKRGPLPARLTLDGAARAVLGAYGNWLLYGLTAVFSLAAVAGGGYLPQATAVIGIFAASVLGAAVVLFVPQGMFVREGVLVFLLHTLLAVPTPEAVLAAALTRLIAMLAEALWAAGTLAVKGDARVSG